MTFAILLPYTLLLGALMIIERRVRLMFAEIQKYFYRKALFSQTCE